MRNTSAPRSTCTPTTTVLKLLLCTEGAAVIYADDDKLTLERGAAAWVAAADGPIRLTAAEPTKLFRVTIGI